MSDALNHTAGPVDNSHSAHSSYKVLSNGAVKFTTGFWANRQSVNHKVSLKHGYAMLNKAGNLHNLKMAAGLASGSYRGMNFSDETVYKWLEALGWELGRAPDAELQTIADEVISLIAAVQQPDGYLNSYYQVVEPEQRWSDLDFSHELYCAGHLIQAAIAFKRAVNDERLLKIVCRFIDHIETIFGPGKKEEACGHPEIEMALVELSRLTGEERYLHLAQFFVDQRGKKKMRGIGANGPEYHQDHVAVREAEGVAGHAVRQMYLAAAVADLYMESGEQALLETSERLWQDMTRGKMYITGGVGSRYDGESFGEAYELPTDQCYCETCAAIGNFFWNWRMLLISGESRYADLMERLMYNGILSSAGLEGASFFYVNPLMLRNGRYVRLSANPDQERKSLGRPEWHSVACCPSNIMRLFASLASYFATHDQAGVQIHQYGNTEISVPLDGHAPVALTVETGYPWDGRVKITVAESHDRPWKLSLRVPGWCQNFSLSVNGQAGYDDLQKGYANLERTWKAGDVIEIEFDMQPFLVAGDPRVDSVRDCLALQRGPIVYCLEEHDQEQGTNLLDVEIDPAEGWTGHWQGDLLGGLMTLEGVGYQRDRDGWPEQGLYRPLNPNNADQSSHRKVKSTAIPYYAWGNRGLKSMRVWIPSVQAL
ncbi:MAG TPA: beta-L-arabinofuranosidase domain-containing protein [Anaerolineales bacterium]|nr:beta-L-arabinofuranosidase domain-containing protein [Anaerolineales bacterium]